MFKNTKKTRPMIAIIGAGAAGIGSALMLAEKGYQIHLFEKDRMGCGASGRNPGRMGLGFHYTGQETAKAYLRASVLVQRTYPGYLIGQDQPRHSPLRRGRYFILKNSDEPREKILACYRAIQEEYQRLIDVDPANEVFGPAKELYRIMEPEEYQDTVNMELIDIGVETAEHLFNWDAFMRDIRVKITQHSEHIYLHESTEVVRITRNSPDKPRFTIEAKTQEQVQPFLIDIDFIINSTWQNIEKFNDQLGLTMIPGTRTNRLKTLLVVKLPQTLKDAHSMFFCMGQHCMFSNLGNGNGMITFAKVTNLEVSTAISISQNSERLIQGGVTETEKHRIAKQMLSGVSQYIPAMIDATPVELKFGIVQTKGSLQLEDLQNTQHPFHQRDDHCVETKQIGIISNPCMKLFYFLDNADFVAKLIESHQNASNIIHRCVELVRWVAQTKNIPLKPLIQRTILENLERYEGANLEEKDINPIVTILSSTIQRKKSLDLFFNQSKSSLSQAVAVFKRKAFTDLRPLGADDEKVPLFYERLAERFNFASTNRKLAVIVVAHRTHSLPLFLELVTRLGKVAAIILKESNYIDSVRLDIENLYEEYLQHELNKKVLREGGSVARMRLYKIFDAPEYQNHQFIILDHGGYFAPCMAILQEEPFVSRMCGVVEHTWNGELRYRKWLSMTFKKAFPIFSIARSELKAKEAFPVVQSSITSLLAMIYGGAGLNQDFYRLECITVVGFGKLGKEIACLLRKLNPKEGLIRVCDASITACLEARELGFLAFQTLDALVGISDLIITATSDIAISSTHMESMKNNACLVCITSRDDQLAQDAFMNFERKKNCHGPVVVYEHKETGKKINVGSDGASFNFLTGSTAHPIIHAVLGADCVAALRCYEIQQTKKANTLVSNLYSLPLEDNDELEGLYQEVFGPFPNSKIVACSKERLPYNAHWLSSTSRINYYFYLRCFAAPVVMGILCFPWLSGRQRSFFTAAQASIGLFMGIEAGYFFYRRFSQEPKRSQELPSINTTLETMRL